MSAEPAPGVLDLFAGAGGLSEGFVRAGFKVLGAVEMDETAARTYRLNHPGLAEERVLVQDIRTLARGALRRLAGRRTLDVLAGSPPCQGFSTVGFRSKKTITGYRADADERNFLFEHMVGAALELKPRLFLMENVPGMQSLKREERSYLEAAAKMLQRGGYRTEIWRLNASAFGVPQDRIRLFLVASRVTAMPARPAEEYQDTRRPDLDLERYRRRRSWRGSSTYHRVRLGRAYRLRNGTCRTSRGIRVSAANSPDSDVVRPSRLLYRHTVRYHDPGDLEQ